MKFDLKTQYAFIHNFIGKGKEIVFYDIHQDEIHFELIIILKCGIQCILPRSVSSTSASSQHTLWDHAPSTVERAVSKPVMLPEGPVPVPMQIVGTGYCQILT